MLIVALVWIVVSVPLALAIGRAIKIGQGRDH